MVLSAFLAEETGLVFFQQYLQFVLGETGPDQARTTSHPVSQPTQGHGLSYGEERQGTLSASQSLNDLFEAEMELH